MASGVDVARVRFVAYTLGGLFAGASALALTRCSHPVTPTSGRHHAQGDRRGGARCVSLAGGRGGLVGAAVGALVIYQLDLVLTRTGLSTSCSR